MYFPEANCPFYRVTYLSNYSPYIAPPGHHSLLSETSYSPYKREDAATIVARVERGMRNTGLLGDADTIASRWLHHVDHSYPVPTLTRDPALRVIQPWLAGRDIVSRGRFGAWMYEIGNMDHSVMQGVEAANWLLEGEPETTWTGAQPKPTPCPVRTLAERRDRVLAVVGAGRPGRLAPNGHGKLAASGDLLRSGTTGAPATAATASTANGGPAADGGED